MDTQSSQEILIQHIEEYRAEHALSYKELANNLNIPYTTLTEMLHKKRIPRIDTVDILAKAMEMDTYELFLPLNRGGTKGERIDAAYEEQVLRAVRRMSERKRKLLLLYVHLLDELDSG